MYPSSARDDTRAALVAQVPNLGFIPVAFHNHKAKPSTTFPTCSFVPTAIPLFLLSIEGRTTMNHKSDSRELGTSLIFGTHPCARQKNGPLAVTFVLAVTSREGREEASVM